MVEKIEQMAIHCETEIVANGDAYYDGANAQWSNPSPSVTIGAIFMATMAPFLW